MGFGRNWFGRRGISAAIVAGMAFGGGVALAAAEATPSPERTSPERPRETVPASMIPARWATTSRIGAPGPAKIKGRTVVIYVATPGYCIGHPQYAPDHVDIIERPRTKKRPFGSAVITAFIFRPAFERVVRGREGGVIYGICSDIGGSMERVTVRLRRPAKRLILYDGSFKTPHRIYPPVGTRPSKVRSRSRRAR